MSRKINISSIVRRHVDTMRSNSTGKISVADVFVFIILPFAIATIATYYVPILKNDQLSLSVNFGAIITALLMSVLVLVYEQESKLQSILEKVSDEMDYSKRKYYQLKIKLMRQLYQNICFSIVLALFLVVFSFVQTFLKDASAIDFGGWVLMFITWCIVFFFMNIVLTMVMIVKRFHALLTN